MFMRWITASFSFLLAAAFGLYGISYLLIVIKSWGSRPDFAQVVLFGSYLPAGGWLFRTITGGLLVAMLLALGWGILLLTASPDDERPTK